MSRRSNLVSLLGNRYGRLVVLEKAKPLYDSKCTAWEVRCDCGTVKVVAASGLVAGRTVSCGCYAREVVKPRARVSTAISLIRAAIAVALVAACGDNAAPAPDAPITVDARPVDALPMADAAPLVDATPPDALELRPCSEVCPTEQWYPWVINGSYEWSYCLPSYQRCIDPAQGGG